MINLVKAEFRKVFTVRSTYVLLGIAILIVVFMSFYIGGLKADKVTLDPNHLADQVMLAAGTVTLLTSFVGMLLVTHEYRYNTISYSLTLARSRSRVLLAKIITISILSVTMALFIGALAPALADLGAKIQGNVLYNQVFPVISLFSRAIYYCWAYSMLAMVFAVIIRVQVGTFMAILLLPGTIEPLLGLLLKKDIVYLPFTSLQGVLNHNPTQFISYQRAALVNFCYLVIAWIIAWRTFLYRDSN